TYIYMTPEDIETEQNLLRASDVIVFQFPLFWYSSPSVLKMYQDNVLAYGFAYGSTGKALNGKKMLVCTSTGGPVEAYQPDGGNKNGTGATLDEMMTPFRCMCRLTGMEYQTPFRTHGARVISDEGLAAQCDKYVETVLAL
ncbi:hypothetical protein KIPB_009144, partial [Kipferlia bialata]